MSVDVTVPLTEFTPPNPDNFGLVVTAAVGSQDDPGEDIFDIVVCTPLWLLDRCKEQGYVLGQHHLIVCHYDWNLIDSTIRRLIENVSGKSWAEVGAKVARIGHWEFEDYASDPRDNGSDLRTR